MKLKTLQMGDNLRENIPYSIHSVPLSVCIDKFDDYFQNEWQCHWHDEYEFGVVLKGSVEFTIYDSQEQPATKRLNQGDGIFIGSGCLHSARGIEPDTILGGFVIPITFFDIKPFKNIYHQNVRPIIESGISNLVLSAKEQNDQVLLSTMKELCAITEQERGYELHYIEMVCKIWRLLTVHILQDRKDKQLTTSNLAQEQRLKEMVSFIHANFSNHINVEDIAKSAGISRTACFRCFQAILKKSPTEYLTEYRLSMATVLLANTNKTLADISSSCGFNSLSYFCKIFRVQCGLSPKKYRVQVNELI